MNIEIEIGSNYLIESICRYDNSTILDFVKELDLAMGDCGFTEELATHLVKSLRVEYASEPDTFSKFMEALKDER